MGETERLTVYYSSPGGRGWATVELLASLAAELLEGELVALDATKEYSRAFVARGLLPKRRSGGPALVIAPAPGHLNALLSLPALRRHHGLLLGWVIDSFWTERIPRVAARGTFDHLFITDGELVDVWQRATGTPTSWLPFGSDVLRLGSGSGNRPRDLQRVGRQPASWEDDEQNALAAAAVGLKYGGRTPFRGDSVLNQRELMGAMGRAKFVLAFSNVAAPADYTHPQHQYLTGRWTDALAMGASVAGIAPRCLAAQELLWPEALEELGTVDRDEGLRRLLVAVRTWSPERAALNYRMALQRLDWRWRLTVIAKKMGQNPANLVTELEALERAIDDPI